MPELLLQISFGAKKVFGDQLLRRKEIERGRELRFVLHSKDNSETRIHVRLVITSLFKVMFRLAERTLSCIVEQLTKTGSTIASVS